MLAAGRARRGEDGVTCMAEPVDRIGDLSGAGARWPGLLAVVVALAVLGALAIRHNGRGQALPSPTPTRSASSPMPALPLVYPAGGTRSTTTDGGAVAVGYAVQSRRPVRVTRVIVAGSGPFATARAGVLTKQAWTAMVDGGSPRLPTPDPDGALVTLSPVFVTIVFHADCHSAARLTSVQLVVESAGRELKQPLEVDVSADGSMDGHTSGLCR